MYILIVGNVLDGLTLIGPFEDPEEATEYAERLYRNEDWIVASVHKPL